ncbi:MAG: hypothetical protein ACOX3G_09375 [Armatimonadota bacterium]|jgi:hypothetical protein
MGELDVEARAFLEKFQDQPEEIRQVFVYVVCQTMVQTGLLRFMGAFDNPGLGITLIYKNPDTGEAFEIIKPEMTSDEEQALQTHITELLQGNARAA